MLRKRVIKQKCMHNTNVCMHVQKEHLNMSENIHHVELMSL